MFGKMLRAHRARALVTQEELAARSGVSVRHIRELEAGRVTAPRPSTVRSLADTLELSETEREEFQRAAQGAAAESLHATVTAAAVAEPAAATRVQGAPDPSRPAQLPSRVAGFAGRTGHLAELDALARRAEETTAGTITVVAGSAGVGKPNP